MLSEKAKDAVRPPQFGGCARCGAPRKPWWPRRALRTDCKSPFFGPSVQLIGQLCSGGLEASGAPLSNPESTGPSHHGWGRGLSLICRCVRPAPQPELKKKSVKVCAIHYPEVGNSLDLEKCPTERSVHPAVELGRWPDQPGKKKVGGVER